VGIPIISDVLDLVGKAVDKVIPDANKREEIKAKLQFTVMEQALEEKKLIFQDLQNARELYKEELREQGVYPLVKSIRALVRPTIAFFSIGFYIYAKTHSLPLTANDYYLFYGIYGFYFGLRTIEKFGGKA
jgi:hypothetical protein